MFPDVFRCYSWSHCWLNLFPSWKLVQIWHPEQVCTAFRVFSVLLLLLLILVWMVGLAEKDHVNHGRALQGMDRPVDVVIAVHHG